MADFTKVQNYFDICKASLKIHDWVVDINDYVIERTQIEALTTEKFDVLPLQVADVQLEEMLLIEPADIDFYDVAKKESIFYSIVKLQEFPED